MFPRIAVAIVFVVVGAVRPLAAQQSRADVIAEDQAKKAAALRPYEPGRLERALTSVERVFVETPSGFYPFFGSVYTGGGFAIGPGYRRYYGDRTFWDLKGLISIRAYKLVELSTASPAHASGRIDLFANAGWRDATQVPFYGTGTNSLKKTRTDFDMKQAYATAGVASRPTSWTVASGTLALEDFRIGDGHGEAPSTIDVHTTQSAPGLGASPTYVHTTVSAGIDWRPAAGYARRGGLYELTYHNYADQDES